MFSKKELKIREDSDSETNHSPTHSVTHSPPQSPLPPTPLPIPEDSANQSLLSPHRTRQGTVFNSVPHNVSNMTSQPGSSTGSSAGVNAAPNAAPNFTLLQDAPPSALWDGTDSNRSVYSFAEEMKTELGRRRYNSEAEKLHFIRSRISKQRNTPAGEVTSAGFYSTCDNVDLFLKCLINDMSAGQYMGDEVTAYLKIIQDTTKVAGSKNLWGAAGHAHDVYLYLKQQFLASEWMDITDKDGVKGFSLENFLSLITYGAYFQVLRPNFKGVARRVTFKPKTSLRDFNVEVIKKGGVDPPLHTPVASTHVSPQASSTASSRPKSGTIGKCSYCHKGSHSLEDCFALFNRMSVNPKHKRAPNKPKESTPVTPSPSTSASHQASSSQSKGKRKWCRHHRSTGHWTSECKNLPPRTANNVAATEVSQQGECLGASHQNQG